LDAAIFNSATSSGVIIATRKDPPRDRRTDLEKRGAKVLSTAGRERVNLSDLLLRLYRIGITSVLIEGGSELAWGALDARVVDRCLFFYAPMIIGGDAAPSGIEGTGIDSLKEAPRLVDVEFRTMGPDMMLNGRVHYPDPSS
jgi:diaminohydroxyphosphoribosylaminopyrimidine deaminase/5-amino-6-(5-phosphoribosylamino)uracil reductase